MSIQLRVSAYDAEIIREVAGDLRFVSKNARRQPPGRKEIQQGSTPMNKGEPWQSTDATLKIHKIARHPALNLSKTMHAKERMQERNLSDADLLHILKNGYVHEDAKPDERTKARCKYAMEAKTPNSDGRTLRLIVIPNESSMMLKIVTIMWVD